MSELPDKYVFELPDRYWISILMSILTAALSVGLVYLSQEYENEVTESLFSDFTIISFYLITFFVFTFLPSFISAYLLSENYVSMVSSTTIGLYGLFFYSLVLILSFGSGEFFYILFVCMKIDLEVLLFAFTGGMNMFLMRGFLRAQYDLVTSLAIKWNIFLIGIIAGTLFYWILVMMPEFSFYSYLIASFIAYSIFLIIFNTALVFSEAGINFRAVNIILILCFIAFLVDVFVNQRFEPILGLDIPESQHFW